MRQEIFEYTFLILKNQSPFWRMFLSFAATTDQGHGRIKQG